MQHMLKFEALQWAGASLFVQPFKGSEVVNPLFWTLGVVNTKEKQKCKLFQPPGSFLNNNNKNVSCGRCPLPPSPNPGIFSLGLLNFSSGLGPACACFLGSCGSDMAFSAATVSWDFPVVQYLVGSVYQQLRSSLREGAGEAQLLTTLVFWQFSKRLIFDWLVIFFLESYRHLIMPLHMCQDFLNFKWMWQMFIKV